MKHITVFTFCAILFCMSYFTFSKPLERYSLVQNRPLQSPPTLTLSSFKDRSFIQNYDTLISDHLIFADELLSLKTRIELFIGKDCIDGVYVTDNMLLKDVSLNSKQSLDDKINSINYFANIYKDVFQTSIMIVPTAIEIYTSELPQFTTTLDQVSTINDIYNSLDNVAKSFANPQLVSNSDSYLYYKTDTNLTSYGSYLLYTALAKELGYKPTPVDRFNIEYASHNFLGNLHSTILYGEDLADKINLYHYSGDNPVQDIIKYEETGIKSYDSIFFREQLNNKNQTSVFLGEHEETIRVRGTNKNGNKLLIFGDDTAKQLMQFLPIHYEEIAIVDLNLLQVTIFEHIDMHDYDQVLFLYDLDNFMNELNINLQLL